MNTSYNTRETIDKKLKQVYQKCFDKFDTYKSKDNLESCLKKIMNEYLGEVYKNTIKCVPVKLELDKSNRIRVKLYNINKQYASNDKKPIVCTVECEGKEIDELKEDIIKCGNNIDFFKYNYYDFSCHNNEAKFVEKISEIYTWFYNRFSIGADYWFYPYYVVKNKQIYGVILDEEANRILTGFGDPYNNILRHNPVFIQILRYLIVSYFDIGETSIPLSTEGLNRVEIEDSVKSCISESILESLGLPKPSFFSKLANATYEKAINSGKFRFYLEHPGETPVNIKYNATLCFHKKSRVTLATENIRKLRKYLQMSSNKMPLVIYKHREVDGEKGAGEWNAVGIADSLGCEQLCSVSFSGSGKWVCKFRNEEISFDGINFRMHRNGANTERENKFDDYKLTADKSKLFAELVEMLQKQSHGTMLIISKHANQEVTRLRESGRAIQIKKYDFFQDNKVRLTDDFAVMISSIDGAIMINEKGHCFGLGVILDGEAAKGSDIGRGARYNSAITYIGKNGIDDCVAVVISEDGTIDILPSHS